MIQPSHVPVMLPEVLDALAPSSGRTVIDGTFGAGGYSRGILETGAEVLALDRDPTAARFAEPLKTAFGTRFHFAEARFSEMESSLEAAGHQQCDGVALDLGVSSMQIDEAERGFSFMKDGPLDMRMGADGPNAADLVNTLEPAELSRIFFVYGEERQARRIAAALARRRAVEPFVRTLDFAESVEKAVGGRRGAPIHPATRVFQALRIAVNQELSELEAGLDAAERVLRSGGRLAVVTFHSLEDRIVKAFFTERAGKQPAGSRHLPPSAAGPEPTFELLFKGARAPGEAELAANPRARSAKLRAGVRTFGPDLPEGGMSFSALFTRRVRGVRLVNVWGLGVLLVLVVGLYLAKTFAGGERADIASTEMQIADEQRKIRLLHAELAYLEQPARIERLSQQYLGMQPASGKHETSVGGLEQISHAAAAAAKAAPPAPPASSEPAASSAPAAVTDQ